mmetsp:Transcript_10291/g.15109  ORF Transcript_10291/g.15109 Transcript_10291/m.15109 type:complete len:115 (+) Transcript_10291:1831-2175(+)
MAKYDLLSVISWANSNVELIKITDMTFKINEPVSVFIVLNMLSKEQSLRYASDTPAGYNILLNSDNVGSPGQCSVARQTVTVRGRTVQQMTASIIRKNVTLQASRKRFSPTIDL